MSDKELQRWVAHRLGQLQRLVRRNPDRRHDVYLFDWSWPQPLEDWGVGRYVYRDGDWVRP